jgi:ATP-dependent protease ClpP protease subunit
MRPSNIRCQQSEQGVELAILGEITSSTAEQIIAAVNFFRDQPVTITVMSGGGDAFASLGLYDFLKGKDVTVRIYGIAASGAAIISAAARTTEMAAGAFLMIHNAYSVIDGQGEDVLESINERQVELFVAKTGMRKDKVKKMLEDETFLSAQEAYDMGFADKVFDPLKMAAQLNQMKPMEEVMSQPATEEVVVAEEVAEVVAAADPGDEQPEKEEVEVEVPVTAVEAVQAALRGHLKAKVNVSARYGAIVAELTSEVKSLRAQLDEANAAVEAAEAKAAGAEQAQEAAAAAEAAAQEAQAQVEQLKATPLEEPIKSDAAPTAVVPGAPVKPTMSPATAHAQRMAQTLDRLDRKLGIKKD